MKAPLSAVAIAAACFFVCVACDRGVDTSGPASGPQNANEPAPLTHTYHTRGIIQSLPEANKPTAELMIQHEAINDFVDGKGAVVGMNAMTMPFPRLAPGVTLDGLAVGDKIAFSFTNTWTGPETARKPAWVVDNVSKLPAETELIFGKKVTPVPEAK
jgi:hypothetical protein